MRIALRLAFDRENALIILTLCLSQILWPASSQEVREEARQAWFSHACPTPAWSTYLYRGPQLPLKRFQNLLAQRRQELACQKTETWLSCWWRATGSGSKDCYTLFWAWWKSLRRVQSPRLVILVLVEE